jgi:predicted dehydrogenase
LAHDIYEIRTMQKIAKEKNLKTQMGTQIHATDNYRRVVEAVQAGAVGKIAKVHVWASAGWGNKPKPEGTPPVPADLDWELWLGPALETPFNPCYMGGNWRSFWRFGNGSLGDMGCHCMDLIFWALGLDYPTAIEPVDGPKNLPEECCPAGITVKYDFPKTEKHDALSMYWYDGKARPALIREFGMPNWGAGVLFVGDKGVLYAHYDALQIFGGIEQFKDYKAPEQTIPKSPGHHAEWFNAIKQGGDSTTLCNFEYGGKVAETVLLGALAYRAGKTIQWNASACQSDNDTVNGLIEQPRRKGWEL